MGKWIENLFEKHKFVRRMLVLWAVLLITWVTYRVVTLIVVIDGAATTLVSIIVGILATVTGFYIKVRELDERDK